MRKAHFERTLWKGNKNCRKYERNLLCSCQSSEKKIEKTKEIRNKACLLTGKQQIRHGQRIYALYIRIRYTVCLFLRRKTRGRTGEKGKNVFWYNHSGDNGRKDPPVPIPNTEVKLSNAESTQRATAREDRSSPLLIFLKRSSSVFSRRSFFVPLSRIITKRFDYIKGTEFFANIIEKGKEGWKKIFFTCISRAVVLHY